ncbi:MAG TPA: type II toxin-antitoxin system VapC family toxin [Polyangiaceae bacterium]|nr:type II toxin-antitoxin system VapC family toxin [Polyangiaceae bacterium]
MRLLLDTHALLWWLADDDRLSQRVREAIADPERTVYSSPASAWEIATKHRIGRLPEAHELLADFSGMLLRAGIEELPITMKHAVLAGTLGGSHRDPFDRMLAAQALCESLEVVTKDDAIAVLGARCLW